MLENGYRARALMCPPDFFGIHYEINPWMNVARAADPERACAQWQELSRVYRRLGVRIELLDPVDGLPDMVFTANAALVRDAEAVMARFRPVERRGEEPLLARWFAAAGYRVHTLGEERYFEGAGDAKFLGGTLYGGFPIRSEREALRQAGELLGVPTVPLELRDAYFYHLDTCFAVLRPDLILYHPPAFTPAAQATIAALPVEKILVSDEDALDFACNCVVLGDDLVLHRATRGLKQALAANGFRVHEVDVSEFLKAGGATGCLTLLL
jgi:N-dimethylarginine dimethylaminohydrolase